VLRSGKSYETASISSLADGRHRLGATAIYSPIATESTSDFARARGPLRPDRHIPVSRSQCEGLKLELEGANAVPMQKDDHGVWSVTTGPLTPDFYGYAFVADG
jgi:hypothetical protein